MRKTLRKTTLRLAGILAILVVFVYFDAMAQKVRNSDIFREITDEEIDQNLEKSQEPSSTQRESRTKSKSASKTSSKSSKASKSSASKKDKDDDLFKEITDEEIESKYQKSKKEDSARDSDKGTKASKKHAKKSTDRRTSRRGKKSRRSKEKDDRTPEERERDRLAHFRKTGVWLWPELSDDDLEKIADEQAKFIQSVQAKCPNTKLNTYESAHFYFVSDCPASIAKECLQFLESAYKQLCRMFSLDQDEQVWMGKCPVIAFCKKVDYQRYEQNMSSAGRCHMSSTGDVFITCFFDDVSTIDNRWRFIGVMVHEMTHGFVHRYKARGIPPLWLNEGMSEFVSSSVVKADKQVPLKMAQGLQLMKTTQSTGHILELTNDLSVPQYGIACGLVKYLVRLKPNGVGMLIDQLKEGKSWEDALMDVYKLTPEALISGFGKINGIPNLQP